MSRRPDRAGFSLLEMLVAMTLMAVLAASVYAALHASFRARSTATASLKPVLRARAALELLRRDLESALPPVGVLAGEFQGLNDQDDAGRPADSLTFYAIVPDATGAQTGSDVCRVELALSQPDEEGAMALVRRVTRNLLAPETTEPPEEVLCRSVLSFDVQYWDGLGWSESWDSTAKNNTLPVAVEVTLELADPEGDPQEVSYRLAHVFKLPCGRPPDQEGTQVIRSSR